MWGPKQEISYTLHFTRDSVWQTVPPLHVCRTLSAHYSDNETRKGTSAPVTGGQVFQHL